MAWNKEILRLIRRLNALKLDLQEQFIGRDQTIELMVLAVVAQEHLLMVGPPGVGKSALAKEFAQRFNGRFFAYQLNAFTEPAALFGPLNVEAFRSGTYRIDTQNMLPQAHLAFLDETFQGNNAILNALLTLLNERLFNNGAHLESVPLLSAFGACNHLPENPDLLPFVDRFALRTHLDSLESNQLDALLERGFALEREQAQRQSHRQTGQEAGRIAIITTEQIQRLSAHIWDVDTLGIQPVYAQLIRELRISGIKISDRRVVKGLKLIAAAALLDESETAELQHLWPLNAMWSRLEERPLLQDLILPYLKEYQRHGARQRRNADELVAELEHLKGRLGTIYSPISASAHLMCLGRLRREAFRIKDPKLMAALETEIQRGISKLEALQAS